MFSYEIRPSPFLSASPRQREAKEEREVEENGEEEGEKPDVPEQNMCIRDRLHSLCLCLPSPLVDSSTVLLGLAITVVVFCEDQVELHPWGPRVHRTEVGSCLDSGADP